eukprot:6488773-Amphidinium_carterae.3
MGRSTACTQLWAGAPPAHSYGPEHRLHTVMGRSAARTPVMGKSTCLHALYLALGSGRAREVDKAAAIAHMVSLVAPTAAALEKLAAEVYSLTTDLGTEKGLSTCQISMREVAPKWCRWQQETTLLEAEEGCLFALDEREVLVTQPAYTMQPEDDVRFAPLGETFAMLPEDDVRMAEAEPGEPVPAIVMEPDIDMVTVPVKLVPPVMMQPEDDIMNAGVGVQAAVPELPKPPSTMFLPNALPVLGIEHVSHNMTVEIHSHLQHWATYVEQVRVIASFLTKRWRRERFIVTCLAHTPFANRAHEVHEFSATLYEHRWHHALLFIQAMWKVYPLLRCFSATRFTEAGTYGGDTTFSAAAVESIVKDSFFAAYTIFIISLDGVPRQLAQWSKGCACHEKLRQHSPAAMRALMQLCYGPEGSCPLLGKRASELAGGCLDSCRVDGAGIFAAIIGRAHGQTH